MMGKKENGRLSDSLRVAFSEALLYKLEVEKKKKKFMYTLLFKPIYRYYIEKKISRV